MRKILTYAFSMSLMPVAFTTLLLTGCADYDAVYEEMMRREQEPTIELRLNIGVGIDHLSRTPKGGEGGDGHELGQYRENDVNKILVYYYQSPNGINASDETEVKRLVYLKDIHEILLAQSKDDEIKNEAINDDPDCTHPATPYLEKHLLLTPKQTEYYTYKKDHHYVVVTNMEDFEPKTLRDLRNCIVSQPWTSESASLWSYNNFVMSNEHDSYCDFTTGDGTRENPYKIIVTIERVAARIDFAYDTDVTTPDKVDFNDGKGHTNVLKYTTTSGTVNLTHVRPFNVMQANQSTNQGTYLIKRFANQKNQSTFSYLNPEKPYAGYGLTPEMFPLVVEPTTWSKGGAYANPTEWYGNTHKNNVDADYASASEYAVHYPTTTDGFAQGYSPGEDKTKYYVLDYANENTMEAGKSLKEYATGYILRAVYEPKTVKEGVWEDDDSDVSTPEVMTGIQDASYTVGTTFYRYRPLVTTFDESQAVYFTLEADANEYGNQQLKATGIPYVIEKYTNGVCYYHVYARHDNSGGSPDATPMEFGIVRNNIYRLKVSFTGPGYPEPEVTNTEPLGIKPYLYTRPWYKVEHEEIEI